MKWMAGRLHSLIAFVFCAALFLSSCHSDKSGEKKLRDERELQVSLLDASSPIAGFLPTSFQDSLAWKRKAPEKGFVADPTIRLVEANYYRFCEKQQTEAAQNYSSPPLQYSIPPCIHFIWLGSSLPEHVAVNIDSWRTCHPGWQIKIWMDEDVASFQWSQPHSQLAFDEAATWAEKSDILRYEILYQHGGIYSDTDVVCFKSFSDLVASNIHFFAGLELNKIPSTYKRALYLGTAVLGASKNCAVMKYAIDHFQTEKESPGMRLNIRSGPGLVSNGCYEALSSSEKEHILILPCSYLYPLDYDLRNVDAQEIRAFVAKESMCMHLWEGSWVVKKQDVELIDAQTR